MMYFHSMMLQRKIEAGGNLIEDALLTELTERKAQFFLKSINKSMSLHFKDRDKGITRTHYFKTIRKVLVELEEETKAHAPPPPGEVKYVKKQNSEVKKDEKTEEKKEGPADET